MVLETIYVTRHGVSFLLILSRPQPAGQMCHERPAHFPFLISTKKEQCANRREASSFIWQVLLVFRLSLQKEVAAFVMIFHCTIHIVRA